MKKKRYRSIYDAMDDVLIGSMDTSGVKPAKEKYKERKEQSTRFTTLEDVLSGNAEKNGAQAAKIQKLQAIIDDRGASQGEKDNARRLLEKIKSKG